MKTSELTGDALDWAVRECTGRKEWNYKPSTEWAQGGPIIEREKIAIKENGYGHWFAKVGASKWMRGPTPLIAAMRCYVHAKLGDEVDVPGELA